MFRTNPLRQRHCLGEAEMRVMQVIAHSVESQVLETFQLGELLFRDPAHVSDVGDVAEAESKYRHLVVVSPYRDYLHATGG